ncbi:ATP synthase subunit I [Megasphaera hutchinsoni]|uniref:ATP synthase subunit I n=1 Tax=Megasphaera hutchinsoni TaxID=1588748 RepID=A0A2J8BC64_9FIRM|nr:ATP synthase subunit I [Megasphaera genomosp. type_2]PNH22359.1 ATP synthase subunit I [Megasphaera genomosp. type_2]
MEELLYYIKRTLWQLVAFTLVGTVILYITGLTYIVAGWCIGNLINMIYFAMLGSRSARAINLPPEHVVQCIRGGFVIRFLVICLAMIVIVHFPQIHLGGVMAGCFSYRIIIYMDAVWQHFHVRKRKEA